jgi:hypothetical protein
MEARRPLPPLIRGADPTHPWLQQATWHWSLVDIISGAGGEGDEGVEDFEYALLRTRIMHNIRNKISKIK